MDWRHDSIDSIDASLGYRQDSTKVVIATSVCVMPAAKVSPSLATTTALNGQSIKSIKCSNSWRTLRPLHTTSSCESNQSSDKSGINASIGIGVH